MTSTADASARPKSSTGPGLGHGLTDLWVEHCARTLPIFDVVIVGSGYGGSVAAAHLAGRLRDDGKPLEVLLLERGNEFLPGEFPARMEDLIGELRITHQSSGQVRGNFEGLFDLRLGDDVAVLAANGLGGGSLINAGVMLEPDGADPGLNDAARDLIGKLKADNCYIKARALLDAQLDNTIAQHPDVTSAKPLPKAEALKKIVLAKAAPLPVTIAMCAGPNADRVQLDACVLCGDCLTGCNVGAKNSHDANLLEKARRAGMRIVTGATVLSLRRSDDDTLRTRIPRHWVLRVVHTDSALQAREAKHLPLRARHVVLAAGTLGSTEILLRSRSDQLVFSPQLGQGFSGNGDNLAAIHRMPVVADGAADQDCPVTERRIGPTITHGLSLHDHGRRRAHYQVQEFAVPGALGQLFDELVTTCAALHELPTRDDSRHGAESPNEIDPAAVDRDAMRKTLLVGIMGHDDGAGVLDLARPVRPRDRPPQHGGLQIRWPQARHDLAMLRRVEQLGQAARSLGGRARVLPNPMWRLLPTELDRVASQPVGPVFTVHPLGGCRYGPGGVVDEYGVVLDGDAAGKASNEAADRWQGSLAVLDGAAIPGSLGVNPALTITAFALRGIGQLAQNWSAKAGAPASPTLRPRRRLELPSQQRPATPPIETKIEVIERLTGTARLSGVGPVVIELSLAYEPSAVRTLARSFWRRLEVQDGHRQTRLRLFDAARWESHQLAGASDQEREPFALLEARLSGSLRFLHREASTACERTRRGLAAWLCNRGTRDIGQVVAHWLTEDRANSDGDSTKKTASRCERVHLLRNIASRAGEVRRFDYELEVTAVRQVDAAAPPALVRALAPAAKIAGSKRLTYSHRGNPWRQLSELSLNAFPLLAPGERACLVLDARFLANQGLALLRITQQANQVRAMADLSALGLFIARIVLCVHLLTFRAPDAQPQREPVRLPGAVDGLPPPEVTELVVDRHPDTDAPVTIRLTRYRPPHPRSAVGRLPLVMIHGYSVGGNTFTHSSLPRSAVDFFCKEDGRDVWVLDLRTSIGLPGSREPWSMEQVALIDIPAALLHVSKATGQRVDVLAHCIGCVMLSMALLTDARDVRSDAVQLGVDSWLTSEQLGVLSAFNGPRPDGRRHPVVSSIVLSQKGPVLRYTDANILRAFVFQTLRRWLFNDAYEFRPPREPTASSALLDRALASLPYPDREFDVENPYWPCAKTPWTATRHRMDALYGRDFDAANMSKPTLDAIDDLFGPVYLDTLAQTIHFARFSAVTNQRGRGEFVTRGNLRKRWGGIPTLAIHGRNNGLVDTYTQALLEAYFGSAQVPFDGEVFDDFGHQDSMIGVQAERVFRRIQQFFEQLPKRPSGDTDHWVIDRPWIGPRLDHDEATQGVALACMSRPDQGRGQLVLLPARRSADPNGSRPSFHILDSGTGVAASPLGNSSQWLRARPPLQACPHEERGEPGWLALIVFDIAESAAVRGRSPTQPKWPAPRESSSGGGGEPPPEDDGKIRPRPEDPEFPTGLPLSFSDGTQARAEPKSIPTIPQGTDQGDGANVVPRDAIDQAIKAARTMSLDELESVFVCCTDLRRALQLHQEDRAAQPLRFVFGSCQYPAGVLDEPVAGRSMHRLAAMQVSKSLQYELALFVGDQIYADATAGLADPVRRDERYEQTTVRALRARHLRGLMRRVPVYTLLDDHEIADNWAPLPAAAAQRRPDDQKALERQRDQGLATWWKLQRMRPKHAGQDKTYPPADEEQRFAGHPFLFMDSRTQRQGRSAGTAWQWNLFETSQMAALKQWLGRHREDVKFVVTPSLLLPRRRATRDDANGAFRSDAWDGHPQSLQSLLEWMVQEQIHRTVFLSGDEHHSLFSIIEARTQKLQPVRMVCIHSSALYAPYPFANGRPSDLVPGHDAFTLGAVEVDVTTQFAPAGDGFAHIAVEWIDGSPQLTLRFIRSAKETVVPPVVLPLS